MGLYKLCEHKGRARDRCEHAWWARFRHARVSLEKWSNREIRTKTDADIAFDELRSAVRAGTFDKRGIDPPREVSPQTFSEFAKVYKERHVVAKGLALAKSIDYCLKPLIARFGDRPIARIRTADIEDFIADLKKPRMVHRQKELRTLTPASINRTFQLMRHMMNWAVGREYLDRTPFRRGTETLIRKLRENDHRRRRLSEDEERRLLENAAPFLRSMIITAVDTGMRRGEMLALRFARRRLEATADRAQGRDNEEPEDSRGADRDGEASRGAGVAPISTLTVRRSLTKRSSSATRPASRSAGSERRGSRPC